MLNKKINIDITTSLYREENRDEKLTAIVEACRKYGFTPGFQLHNSGDKDEIEWAASFGLPLTAHAPLMSPWQINLGTKELGPAKESLKISAEIMRAYNIVYAVFHGFMMTDKPVPGFGRGVSYDEAMSNVYRPDLVLPNSTNCCDFTGWDEYAERVAILKENLAWLRKEYPDLKFLIENDFPSYVGANLFSDTSVKLEHDGCLDSGHLWTSSFLYGRDFLTEAKNYVATGRIKMVHFHSSTFTDDILPEKWGDGHKPLDTPGQIPMQEFLDICKAGGINHYVLEIRGITANDIEIFAAMWNRGGGE